MSRGWHRESRSEEQAWREARAADEELREEFERLAHERDPDPDAEEHGEYERIDDPHDGESTQEAYWDERTNRGGDREPGF